MKGEILVGRVGVGASERVELLIDEDKSVNNLVFGVPVVTKDGLRARGVGFEIS